MEEFLLLVITILIALFVPFAPPGWLADNQFK